MRDNVGGREVGRLERGGKRDSLIDSKSVREVSRISSSIWAESTSKLGEGWGVGAVYGGVGWIS